MKLVFLIFLSVFSLVYNEVSAVQADDKNVKDIKDRFGIDITQFGYISPKDKQITTRNISYAYTSDNYIYHQATYQDVIIGTVIDGPREGLQAIVTIGPANQLIDTCASFVQHSEYFVHTYSWGEVRTYRDRQVVILK